MKECFNALFLNMKIHFCDYDVSKHLIVIVKNLFFINTIKNKTDKNIELIVTLFIKDYSEGNQLMKLNIME